MNAESYLNQTAQMWNQQVESWMGTTTEVQTQAQKLIDLWSGQAEETFKEGQKFAEICADTLASTQKEFWGAWENLLKGAEGLFVVQPVKKKKA